ncbi:hypothetical protein [Curtobacterium herbarum]|uniref:Uncharacterized protein n=1 Tax=Curtobacterium herbarum TaxID=150122 RepID=A0ABP4K6M9_9MICO|nr:hypothetical protein [Curtobacterium herbarum]MBM7474896.1 hypothetical protein [Curtobacterium herbarum]MCS6545543.1 hypothetical protein [Curtobacterium herbarum]
MTNTASSTKDTAAAVDATEVRRLVAMVRHELSETLADARRAKPFYAATQDEAAAKAKAASKALNEFASTLNKIKVQG